MRKRVQDIPKTITQLRSMVEEFQKTFLGGEKLALSDVLGEDLPVMVVVDNAEREHEERMRREKEQRAKKHESSTTTTGAPAKKLATAAATATKPRVPMKPKN